MPASDDPRPDGSPSDRPATDDPAADDELRRLADLALAAVRGELTTATAEPGDNAARRVAHVIEAIRGAGP
jgi:hypothetical protein